MFNSLACEHLLRKSHFLYILDISYLSRKLWQKSCRATRDFLFFLILHHSGHFSRRPAIPTQLILLLASVLLQHISQRYQFILVTRLLQKRQFESLYERKVDLCIGFQHGRVPDMNQTGPPPDSLVSFEFYVRFFLILGYDFSRSHGRCHLGDFDPCG